MQQCLTTHFSCSVYKMIDFKQPTKYNSTKKNTDPPCQRGVVDVMGKI